MSAATVDLDVRGDAGVRFTRVVTAEWGKLWALRSTWAVAAAGVAAEAVAGAMAPLTSSVVHDGVPVAAFDAARIPVIGLPFVQLAVLVLAVLTVSNEYATGLVRTTLAAVPTRLPVLWAKTLVVTAATLAVAVVGGGLGLAAGLVTGGGLYRFGLDGPQTARLLVSGPLYLALVAALAVGVATVVRGTAAALGVLVGELLVLETLLSTFSSPGVQHVAAFLPQTAGLRLTATADHLTMGREAAGAWGLAPWAGLAVLAGWAVLCLGAGAVSMSRRDV